MDTPYNGTPAEAQNDDLIFQRACNNDALAAATLWNNYKNRLYRYAKRLLGEFGDDDTVFDVLQEAWEDLFSKGCGHYQAQGNFSGFLFTYVHHRAFDELRMRQRRGKHIAPLPDDPDDEEAPSFLEQLPDMQMDLADSVERENLMRHLMEHCLPQLPPAQREVVVLKGEGLTEKAIAQVQNTTRDTIKTRWLLALNKLKTCLGV